MATIINDLKEVFRRGELHVQLIFVNVAMFLVFTLVQIVLMLFNISIDDWLRWLEMPASLTHFLRQPWTIITYMFMHASVMHLLFNMLWLYWFGRLFLFFFSARHLRGVYFLGGICGGLLYLCAYNVFPFFIPYSGYTYMVGASAAVLAIVAAVAYREPDFRVNLILLGSFPLKYFALLVIGFDLLFVTTDNAGGHIAHLGGALGGLLFAYFLNKGNGLTHYLNKVIDFCCYPSAFFLKSRKPRMKVNYGGKTGKTVNEWNSSYSEPEQQIDDEPQFQSADKQARINEIREKIKHSGYQGLTEEEKKELFNTSIR